jgi:hypothetical protein
MGAASNLHIVKAGAGLTRGKEEGFMAGSENTRHGNMRLQVNADSGALTMENYASISRSTLIIIHSPQCSDLSARRNSNLQEGCFLVSFQAGDIALLNICSWRATIISLRPERRKLIYHNA